MGPDDAAALVDVLVRAIRAVRVLEVGVGSGRVGMAIAGALPADGLLIALEKDAALAVQTRDRLAAAGLSEKASVMIGDAPRFLHKLAGPFDLIVQDCRELEDVSMIDRLVHLLRAGGTIVSHNTAGTADYNKRLAADTRLTTVFVPAGDGVALSVKRQV
jgi:predicted O-methyltransferase YrrM